MVTLSLAQSHPLEEAVVVSDMLLAVMVGQVVVEAQAEENMNPAMVILLLQALHKEIMVEPITVVSHRVVVVALEVLVVMRQMIMLEGLEAQEHQMILLALL